MSWKGREWTGTPSIPERRPSTRPSDGWRHLFEKEEQERETVRKRERKGGVKARPETTLHSTVSIPRKRGCGV